MINAHTMSLRLLTVGLVLAISANVLQAGKPAIPAQQPAADATTVQLFDGIEAGQLDAKLVHKDESTGNLFIDNKTDKLLNVQMPEAFIGVHVLNQGFFDQNNGQNGQNAGQGQGGQTTGGGASNNSQQGPGIFSVPPQKIVRIPVRSVCLEHGRPDPSSRMEYRVFPVEKFSLDPALFELLATIGRGGPPQKVAQATAWHLANGKSWKELAAMKFRRLGGLPDVPHFKHSELDQARKLAEASRTLADNRIVRDSEPAVVSSAVARNDAKAR
ncbi:MAG: hypothetical protein O3B13_24015 [Planctomycetota bacterium]|nr:hypothetical protein [Planctomycetota bacterium]